MANTSQFIDTLFVNDLQEITYIHWRVHVFHITFCPFGYGKQKGRETNDTQFRSRRRSQERRFINSNVRRKCEKQWLAYFD